MLSTRPCYDDVSLVILVELDIVGCKMQVQQNTMITYLLCVNIGTGCREKRFFAISVIGYVPKADHMSKAVISLGASYRYSCVYNLW